MFKPRVSYKRNVYLLFLGELFMKLKTLILVMSGFLLGENGFSNESALPAEQAVDMVASKVECGYPKITTPVGYVADRDYHRHNPNPKFPSRYYHH